MYNELEIKYDMTKERMVNSAVSVLFILENIRRTTSQTEWNKQSKRDLSLKK